ncbi:MAG: hypothetical protein K2X86_05815 [Cytophagaceae bacterium]|nr:hypothetical protein [Cytophagaceae bacterium]
MNKKDIKYNIMRIMNKQFFISMILVFSSVKSLYGQSVYFNGLGRVIVTNDKLRGAVLDSTSSHSKDTLSPRKSTGGYTLFDLGVNIQANENLRGSIILRVRNEFGGFYGQGVSLGFRQIRLEGVAAKRVKFQLGDIDMGLTPYTIYNPFETYYAFEAEIFKIRRNIVHYENFNYGNNWRVQGGDAVLNLIFSKGIEKVKFRLFGARIKKFDETVNMPDRVFFGGRTEIIQSKFIQIGGNYVRTTDVLGTVPDTIVNFNNSVVTGDYKLSLDIKDKFEVSASGEAGTSNYSNFLESAAKTVKHDDYFYDVSLAAACKPIGVKITASYRNIGPEYHNPLAQTRRIFDFAQPTIFGTLQNANGGIRTATLMDRYSQEGIYNPSISTVLMPYLPQYGNVTPYGIATPNRKGIMVGLEKSDTSNVLRAEATTEFLSEVVGEGTVETRDFLSVRGGIALNIGKLIHFKRNLGISAGGRYENTSRSNSTIDFTTIMLDAGINFEIVKDLDILVGYKLLNAEGVEFLSQRDAFNSITSIPMAFDINEKQGIMALGLRYNFSAKAFFTMQAHVTDFENGKNANMNYNMNQLFFNYTIAF